MAQGKAGTGPVATCPGCQAEFWRPPSWARRGIRFCSRACRAGTIRETRACERCATPYATRKSSARRFCSQACSIAAKVKTTVEPCARCGTSGGYIAAGCVRPARRRGEAFGYDGKLCNACHGNVDQAKRRAAARQQV